MSYFIYQSCHNDCGLTCVKILMANLSKNRSFLFLSNPKENDESYSLKDLILFGEENGLKLKAFKSEDRSLTSSDIKTPCIITLKKDNGGNHAIFIKKIYKNHVLIYDPEKGIFKKKISIIEACWDGKILEVDEFNPKPLSLKKPQISNYKDEIILCLIQLSSLIACFVSMYFINTNKNLILSLCTFCVFLFFQFIHQIFLINSFKRFDEKYIDLIYDPIEERRKEKYQLMHSFKQTMFSTPSQLVSSLITSIFIIILLILNLEKMIYACIILLAVAAIDGFIIDPYMQHQKDELDFNESSLLKSNLTEESFNSKLKDQSNLAYAFSSKIFIKRIAFIFITLFLDLVIMIITNNVQLSSIIFYFFLMYFMFENLDDSMLFFNRRNLMNRTKERFLFYFKQKI